MLEKQSSMAAWGPANTHSERKCLYFPHGSNMEPADGGWLRELKSDPTQERVPGGRKRLHRKDGLLETQTVRVSFKLSVKEACAKEIATGGPQLRMLAKVGN